MEIDFGKVLVLALQEVLPPFATILVPCIVVFWPGPRIEKKFVFVVVSASLSWGLPAVLAILLYPIEWYLFHIEPAVRDLNYKTIPDFLISLNEYGSLFYIGLAATLSILAPIYLRIRIWPKLFPTELEGKVVT